MKIYVFPRSFFESIKETDVEDFIINNYNIISINTPEYKPKHILKEDPPFSKKYWTNDNILILYFHDWITQEDELVKLITDQDVDNIVEFVNRFDKNKNLIIHCTAGLSRSGAVGSCLNQFLNGINNMDEYNEFVEKHPHIRPNSLVYQKLHFKLKNYFNNIRKQ